MKIKEDEGKVEVFDKLAKYYEKIFRNNTQMVQYQV